MIPYNPQTIEQCRERFHLAVAGIVEVEDCERGAPTPGSKPEHVFDFNDGLRLIVSRDRYPDGKIMVHFSASANPDSGLYRWLKRSGSGQKKHFGKLATAGFAAISGCGSAKPALVEFAGISLSKGVPHWVVTELTGEHELEELKK